ncbi:MAG: hypothetical protein ACLGIR_07310 [Actinomycetes bacterium]
MGRTVGAGPRPSGRAGAGALAVASVLAMAAPAAASTTGPAGHALWVWDPADVAAVATVLDAGADTLYLHVPPGAARRGDVVRRVEEARAAGVRVVGVAGDPSWADDRRADLLAWVTEVAGAGLVDALVVDVEPHLLPDWSSSRRRARLIESFVGALHDATQRAGATPLSAVVPFWFDDADLAHRRHGPLLDRVVAATDGIVVLAYRDTTSGPNGILALVRRELDVAAAAGRTAVVGVETVDTGLGHVDFSAETRADVTRVLGEVRAAWGTHPGFGGTAVHDARGWRALP